MVNYNATIGGTSVTNIFDVDYSEGETAKLGKAVIVCADNTNNRNFESGEEVTITKNGTDDFTGFVTGKPTSAGSDPGLEIECKDRRLELKFEQVSRVFYNMDTGDIIKEALNKRTELRNEQYVHKGDDLTNWSSNLPEFELGNIDSQSLHEAGNDFIFGGWVAGAGSEQSIYNITYSNVPSKTVPGDGTIDRFYTRLLINNRGQQFSGEVDLRDDSGNNYIWPLELRGSRFEEVELNAEEATTDASIGNKVTTDGTLEYRFKIDGELSEARAVAIDYAKTIPFNTRTRSTTLNPSGVVTTGRTITRRIDRSIFELIKELATEDGHISYIDTNDVLYYEPSGQTTSSLKIDHSTTPVTKADFDRDYENITNKVTVQGAGDVRVTLEDNASINFYGVSPREEPIVDESIQTRSEATERGRGYLKKHAWDDVAFTFEVADASYQQLGIGENVEITWPPENINGTYTVSDIETDKHGIVTLSFTDTDAI